MFLFISSHDFLIPRVTSMTQRNAFMWNVAESRSGNRELVCRKAIRNEAFIMSHEAYDR